MGLFSKTHNHHHQTYEKIATVTKWAAKAIPRGFRQVEATYAVRRGEASTKLHQASLASYTRGRSSHHLKTVYQHTLHGTEDS